MIASKDDLAMYLEMDKKALKISKNRPSWFGDEIWRYQILLRKFEYLLNCGSGIIAKIEKKITYHRLHSLELKLGFSIPPNVFGPGLSIAHYGCIAVNHNTKVGRNCRIHEGVTIGATGDNSDAPQIGNNVFIGSGAKIIGNVKIADRVAIGANAVVVKSILEENITVAGVPARKISANGSKEFIVWDVD
ncbi:MAG: serine acetyltransferase [Methylococcaceae bacterium]|nr:serine acetyltransferase [Methylococcaceae bacterium]